MRSADVVQRLRDHLASRSIRDLGLGAFLVALLVSGLFGGWQQAADETATLAAGETVSTQPLEVTVHGVATADDLGTFLLGPTEGRYVVVVADIVSHADRSIPRLDVRDVVQLAGVEGVYQRFAEDLPLEDVTAQILVADDRSPLGDVGPGLTYRTWFVWEQRPGAPAPTEATVEVFGKTYRASSVNGAMGWFSRTLAARGSFPVAASPEAVAP